MRLEKRRLAAQSDSLENGTLAAHGHFGRLAALEFHPAGSDFTLAGFTDAGAC